MADKRNLALTLSLIARGGNMEVCITHGCQIIKKYIRKKEISYCPQCNREKTERILKEAAQELNKRGI